MKLGLAHDGLRLFRLALNGILCLVHVPLPLCRSERLRPCPLTKSAD